MQWQINPGNATTLGIGNSATSMLLPLFSIGFAAGSETICEDVIRLG